MDAEEIIFSVINSLNDTLSGSSSSSDEEWIQLSLERGKRKSCERIKDYINVIRRYGDFDFKSHFRINRATFQQLAQLLNPDIMRKTSGYPTFSAEQQLMVALWKMSTTKNYRSICDRFNIGRATAVRIVRRVTHALFKHANKFIKWPIGYKAATIMQGFEEASGFINVIGAIDGTHIEIEAPKENPVDYVNHKGYHSIHLQVVCDHKYLITHCYAGNPGSVHDQRVLRQSEIANFLNNETKFPMNSHFLGDAAYELHPQLLTPFRNNGFLDERQRKYNYYHARARVCVERCIGLLKCRLRSLLHCLPMRRIDLIAQYIIACCVIHNICILEKDNLDIQSLLPPDDENIVSSNIYRSKTNDGAQKRDLIMKRLQ